MARPTGASTGTFPRSTELLIPMRNTWRTAGIPCWPSTSGYRRERSAGRRHGDAAGDRESAASSAGQPAQTRTIPPGTSSAASHWSVTPTARSRRSTRRARTAMPTPGAGPERRFRSPPAGGFHGAGADLLPERSQRDFTNADGHGPQHQRAQEPFPELEGNRPVDSAEAALMAVSAKD